MAWRLTPLIYQGLQAGVQCALPTGETHIFAGEVYPEFAFRRKEEKMWRFRPAVKVAFTETLHLGNFGVEGPLVFGRFSYKFSPKEDDSKIEEVSESGYSVIQLQKWSNILESMYSFGWSYRKASSDPKKQDWAIRISYAETLPFELRRFGFLEDTAAVNFKTIDVSARKKYNQFTLGGGLGYAAVTIDTVRLSLFYPTLMVDYTW